jgi:hypothetical protein
MILITHEVFSLTAACAVGVLCSALDYGYGKAFVFCVCAGIIVETVWGLGG